MYEAACGMEPGPPLIWPRLAVLLLALAGCTSQALVDAPVVDTTLGPLRGTSQDGIHVFRGVPYAAPPVADLRWRPPRPPAPWTATRDATRFGPICPQELRAAEPDQPQSEDCLSLNVYAPASARRGPLPVMVWLHGGSFRWGAGSLPVYDGVTFARQGVVLVTLNYRLDRLGRFAHPVLSQAQAGEPLANYGLMDQIAALNWVRDNIGAFGGDPRRVTIFGFSAGGVSVNALMTSPAAQGLFQRAIAQSGGVSISGMQRLNEAVGRQKSLEQDGLEFAASLGIPADPTAPRRLRALTVGQILAYPVKDSSMNPVVDGDILPIGIGDAFREGLQHRVPYLAGANSWEASLIRPFNLPLAAILAGVPADRAREVYGPLPELELKEAYFGDALFLAPAWTLAAAMSNVGVPAWLYYYSYVNEGERGQVPGAAHGAEVSHLFRHPLRPGIPLGSRDLDVSEPLRRYWVRFAQAGNPNGPGLPEWPAFTREQPKVMEFGEMAHVLPTLLPARIAFHTAAFDSSATIRR